MQTTCRTSTQVIAPVCTGSTDRQNGRPKRSIPQVRGRIDSQQLIRLSDDDPRHAEDVQDLARFRAGGESVVMPSIAEGRPVSDTAGGPSGSLSKVRDDQQRDSRHRG